MDKNERNKFNPFGDPGYAYAPDVNNGYHVNGDKSKLGWSKILMYFVLALLFITLIGNIVFTTNQRNNAVESMGEFNTQAGELHRLVSTNIARDDFREIANTETAPEEVTKLAEGVASVSEYLKENDYTPLNESMTNDQASEIVIPYYAICDAVENMKQFPNMNTGEYGAKCSEFSEVSLTMMGDIKNFNTLNSGIAGFLNPLSGDNLPDVTS